MSKNKYLITQSLLSAFDWIFKREDGYEDFLKTLNYEKDPPNQRMLDGRQFESMVTAYANGAELDQTHKWSAGIKEIGDIVKGGQFQVKLSRDMNIEGVDFVLYGILDNLKCGTIYDIKFSKNHKYNKYFDSPQYPFYFKLCPEAKQFDYLVSDGKNTYRETYYPFDAPSIEYEITQFMNYLKVKNLLKIYIEKWESKY